MSKRKTIWAAAGVAAVLALTAGLAVIALHPSDTPKTPPDDPVRDQSLAKAALTQIQSQTAGTLGMTLPLNAQPHAPIYPDGLILDEALSPTSPTAGKLQYAAAAPLGAVVEFYKEAAARARLPAQVTKVSPDVVELRASDGRRLLHARMTRQFIASTVVDLDYS